MRGIQSGLRKKVGRKSDHRASAAESLNSPDKCNYFRSAKVNTFETVEVSCAGEMLLFELIGIDHHADGGIWVEVLLAS